MRDDKNTQFAMFVQEKPQELTDELNKFSSQMPGIVIIDTNMTTSTFNGGKSILFVCLLTYKVYKKEKLPF